MDMEVRQGMNRCNRILHTLINCITTLLIGVVVVILSTPSLHSIVLIDSWTSKGIIDLEHVQSAQKCSEPDFLLFNYQFNGLTVGCICNSSIVHSGYCTLAEFNQNCRESAPVQPAALNNYNNDPMICARLAKLKACSKCLSGFCPEDDNLPCPIVDLKIAIFPPSVDYYSVVQISHQSKILFASRNILNQTPIFAIRTVKGNGICLANQKQVQQGYNNEIYKSVTLESEKCSTDQDETFKLLMTIPDYNIYSSNNLSIRSQGNSFRTYIKSIAKMDPQSVEPTLKLGVQGSRFVPMCSMLSIIFAAMLIIQQLIIHYFLKSSASVMSSKYYTLALSMSYLVNTIVPAYGCTRLFDYVDTGRKINIKDESMQHLETLLEKIDLCGKMLIVVTCLNITAFIIKLAVDIRQMCKKNQPEDMPNNKN